MTQDILSLAGLTAMVGMGVVFSALVLLSVYMYIFKYLLASFEERKRQKATPPKIVEMAAPEIEAAPAVASQAVDEEEVAAAIALAMHLEGLSSEVAPEEVAAIALALHLGGLSAGSAVVTPDVAAVISTALHLDMQAANAAIIAAALEPAPPEAGTGSWKMAGLAESHAMRFQLQAKPRRVAAA